MKERDSEDQKICPHCHYDQSRYTPDLFTLKPYEVLNGRYLVGRVLGKGGFGITYIAMDMILERVVAIKEFFVQGYMYRDNSNSTSISISTTSGASEEEYYRINREKFEKEAKIIASLDDLPGIVKVYDFFYENETVYMVLEYLNGINFKEYTRKKGGRLPYKEVLNKTMTVMKSLQRLHENGIIHRDISPDNIMVMDTGTVKLLDFGGAKIQANTALSSIIQTEIRDRGQMFMQWLQLFIIVYVDRFPKNPSTVWKMITLRNPLNWGLIFLRKLKRFFLRLFPSEAGIVIRQWQNFTLLL